MNISYTAVDRRLKAGHTAGTAYTISVGVTQFNPGTPSPVSFPTKSKNGNLVTITHRIEEYINVKTDWIQASGGTPDEADMLEFLWSVAAGETFVLNNGSDLICVMAGKAKDPQIHGLYKSWSFRVEVIG